MELKTKSTLMIISSLIIGIIIGVIATMSIIKPKLDDRVDIRKRGSYKEHMFEIIKPDESQKDSLEVLIKKYEEKMMIHHKNAMAEYRNKADSLNEELKRFLTPEQMEKLEKYHKERKKRYQRRKDKRNEEKRQR